MTVDSHRKMFNRTLRGIAIFSICFAGCGSTENSNSNDPHGCLGGKCDIPGDDACVLHETLALGCDQKCSNISPGETDPTCYPDGTGAEVQFSCVCSEGTLQWYRSSCGSSACDQLLHPEGEFKISDDSLSIERLYAIQGPQPSNGYTATLESISDWETVTLPLLRVDNGRGLTLWFIYDGNFHSQQGEGKAPYGARLFRARFGDQELLYTNLRGKLSPNWGPPWFPKPEKIQGWIGLGGAESCFPTNEHGYYPAVDWNYSYRFDVDGSFRFTSSFIEPNGPVPLEVAVSYVVPRDGVYWKTIIQILNPDSFAKTFQYWHNYILPAGSGDSRDEVEVLLPEVTRIEVHSTGDPQLGAEHNLIDWVKGAKVTMIHGPQGPSFKDQYVQGWLGLFNHDPEGRNAVSRYGFFNHSRGIGLGMVDAREERTVYPKSFGGPGIGTENWTDNGSRYVEMWYSPVVRSFWDETSLSGNGVVTHETLQFPFRTETEFMAFDPAAPQLHQPDPGKEPDPSSGFHETFDGPVANCSDGSYDAEWAEWFDGDRWGAGHQLLLSNGEQSIGLESGSYGLSRNFGDIGGMTLTVIQDYNGNGWYEILTDQGLLQKYQSPVSGTASFTLPPGCREIKFKIGQTSGPFSRVVLSDLTLQ